MQTITVTTPDDWHVHLRDHELLKTSVADTSRFFNRAIVMPNLKPPIATVEQAKAYLTRIQQAIPQGQSFNPLLTLYLTPTLSPAEILKAKTSHIIFACKFYPHGVTTNSNFGISTLQDSYPTLEAMQTHGIPLLIHGETPDKQVDIFDRESCFIEQILTRLLKDFPKLKMVLEHISTETAVNFVQDASENLAATITPHHLLLNRNDVLSGGIKVHNYCLPIVKRERDRLALLKAATSGNKKFFLGTDSAPHAIETKETACGCAGIYSAFHAIPLYLEAFEAADSLDKFEAFASHFGAQFYGLPINSGTLTFCKDPWKVPEKLSFGDSTVVPLLAGQTLQWQLAHD